MLKFSSRKKMIFIGIGLTLSLLAFFQNCSEVKMSSIPVELSGNVALSIEGADANSVYYTNSRTLTINIIVKTDLLDEVRVSTKSPMTDAKNPWRKVIDRMTFDLEDEYAFDGSKDGSKTLYLEFRNSLSDQLANRVYKNLAIFLDTQAPEIAGKEFLTKGVQGTEYKKAQKVKATWDMADKMPSSGQASGMHTTSAVRWGYTRSNDCSESALFQKVEWRGPAEVADLSWPTDDPLEVFYVCLFAKDRAGNINTYLSQPMTSLWSVVAGDNSQGNGASVLSPKVRFKTPSFISLAPNGDIRVRDLDFNNWRNISAVENNSARLIETLNLPIIGDTNLVYDRAGNSYVGAGQRIYMIKKNSTEKNLIVQSEGSIVALTIRNYKSVESLVFSYYKNMTAVVNNPASEAFLFEVPLSKLMTSAASAVPVSMSDLKTKYKLVGNGMFPERSYNFPASIVLSKNDPAQPQYAVGRVLALTTGDAGEIYVSSQNFASTTIGNTGLRRLTQKSDGTFLQELLPGMNDAGRQVSYIKKKLKDKITREVVLATGSRPGAMIYDFATQKRIEPFADLKDHYCFGAMIAPHADGSDYSFYIGSASTSQIYHYDSAYKLIEILGRPVHDNITDPLAAMIGEPSGLAMDHEEGSLYFVDNQNALVRRVDKDGVLRTVAGKVQNYTSKTSYNNESMNDFVYDTYAFNNGYGYQMAADFNSAKNRKVLYLPLVTGQVHALDLVGKKVNTLLKPSEPFVAGSTPQFWTNTGIAFVRGPGDKNALLTNKIERITSGRYVASINRTMTTGFIHLLPVQGTQLWQNDVVFMGDISNNTPQDTNAVLNNSDIALNTSLPTVVTDSLGYVFVSGLKGLKISSLNSTSARTRFLEPLKITEFGMIEDGTKRHFVYVNGSSKLMLSTIDMADIFNIASNPIVGSAKRLCLPGTELAKVAQVITDDEGNLLLSDAKNARILKYRIRDAAGNLKWTTNCP